MGGLISKALKYTSEPKTVQTPGNISEDPRSPTEGVHRTPLAVGKKNYLETDIDDFTPSLPLRLKLLRKSVDPRSPTVGINRTPIALLQSSPGGQEFESPVSLYSNYQTDIGSFACFPSPPEPSVNVSDFEGDAFSKELDSLVNELANSFSDSDSPPADPVPFRLRAESSKKPIDDKIESKAVCEDLVLEIIESFKEFEDEVKAKRKPKNVVQKLALAPAPLKVVAAKPKLLKTRKPLSNITSSAGNTPTKLKVRKENKLVKVDLGSENSPITNMKIRAQWDQESTVII